MASVRSSVRIASAPGTRPPFFLRMSVACLAVAVAGFFPTYFMPLASGALNANPAVHFHGALFFGWMSFVVLQSWLVAHGSVGLHRSLGLLGISLATLIPVATVLGGVNRAQILAAAGAPRAAQELLVGATAIDIAIFVALFAAAIANIHNTEAHRRLVLVATVSTLGAALNRIFLVHAQETATAFFQQFRMELPILTADLLLVPLLVHDWRSRGRIHPATIWGVGTVLLLHIVRVPLYGSAFSALLGGHILGFVG
jgi:hypothetical protein